jgi:LIVCS family branched-chain amino acid:cation transporter
MILSMIGCAICNLGLSTIIEAASPILSVICPPFMTTVVLLFFQDHIRRPGLYKGAALGASLLLALHSYFKLFPLVSCLPFYDYGFGWLIPAIVGGVLGWLLSKPDSAGAEQ